MLQQSQVQAINVEQDKKTVRRMKLESEDKPHAHNDSLKFQIHSGNL